MTPLSLEARYTARTLSVSSGFITAGLLAALLLYRNHRLMIGPELWAEDIMNYFIDDRLFGTSALLIPHNGFVQLCCRLVALLAGFVDPVFAPRIYSLFFVASIALTAALVYTSPLFHGRARMLAALALVAAPVSSEVFYGMCYMQWVMGPLVAIALCERAPSTGRAALLFGCFSLLGASSPFALIAAPFVLIKIWTERSFYAKALATSVLLTSTIHFDSLVSRFTSSSASGQLSSKVEAIASTSYRWLVGGQAPTGLGCAIIGIGTLAGAIWYLTNNRHLLTTGVFYVGGFALALLFVSCWSIGPDPIHQYGPGGRYFYIPLVLALWVVLLIEQDTQRASVTLTAPPIAFAALFFAHTDRAGYHFIDTDWLTTAACLQSQPTCTTQINPNWLGRVSVPSDAQLKNMTAAGAASFQRAPAR